MSSPYTVKSGDSLSAIAAAHGIGSWQEIYNHPDNAAFRELRPNPDLIKPGDQLFIPTKDETGGSSDELPSDQTSDATPAGSPNNVSESTPVGGGTYVAHARDCILSIAHAFGLPWEKVWNDPQNAQLQAERKDPRVLMPGDKVFVPKIKPRVESKSTDQKHKFIAKRKLVKLRLHFYDEGKPLKDLSYKATIEGRILQGSADGDGLVELKIPASAFAGTIVLDDGNVSYQFELVMGALNPRDSISGMQMRLNNLGFSCGAVDGVFGSKTRRAMRTFQKLKELPLTDQPNQATFDKLLQVHGS